MNKLNKRTFKGIEYIRLSALPTKEAEMLQKTLTNRTLIKIMVSDEVIEDCVLYTAYEAWFSNYQPELTEPIKPTIRSTVSLS